MEKNTHSFLSSFSKSKIVSPSTTFKNSQQIFNYLSWKNGKQTKGNLGKALTNQKSLNNISGLRTLLGDMSRLKENMLHSARSWDKNSKSNNKNSQSYERELIIKSIDQDTDPQEPICRIKVHTDGNQNKLYVYKASNTDHLREFLEKKYHKIKAWKVSPPNISLDYYLTLQNKDISFLNGKDISLEPFKIQKHSNLSLNSFDIMSCIGTGGFSKVYLCRFKGDGKFYAMKVINKNFIVKNKKKGIVMNEKNIMESLSHPFIVEMKFSFETKNSLIFVLEFCPGGELFGLVKKFKVMNESIARFYMVEILLGLEEVHRNGIVYRDFKPENILIDMAGHVRIADFGLAKPGIWSPKDKAYSFCGSPEYMPPEMILKKGHSLPVDFYCLGALLYELVTGLPPFYSQDPDEIFEDTINKQIYFPSHTKLSDELKSLLKSLLCKEEARRLGSYNGIKEVLTHPWFHKIDKEVYLRKEMATPVQFESMKDLKLILGEMEVKNKEYILEILEEQKEEEEGNFEIQMEQFYYDWRDKNRKSYRQTFRSNKENTHHSISLERNTHREKLRTATSQGKILRKMMTHRIFTSNASRQNKPISTRDYLNRI